MFRILAEDLFYLCSPIKCMMKCPLSSLKVEMEFGAILLNHTLASSLSVVGIALHIILSGTPCKCMRVLSDSRWLSESFDPLYSLTWGIRNLGEKGQDMTCAAKGESIRQTNWSKLVDTRPHGVHHHVHLIFHNMHILHRMHCTALQL